MKYEDIPPVLVHAVVSAEDKRFFQHSGFDPIRIIKAAYIDVSEHRYAQGASTLSQQLARMFWLDNDKTWRRKIPEVLITMHLEQKLKKEQIFEVLRKPGATGDIAEVSASGVSGRRRRFISART